MFSNHNEAYDREFLETLDDFLFERKLDAIDNGIDNGDDKAFFVIDELRAFVDELLDNAR